MEDRVYPTEFQLNKTEAPFFLFETMYIYLYSFYLNYW